ncbi:MAG: nucleotide-binding protein [Pedobacter sp.]|nr:MAG: nucleotide-binding protein [Pedobacter sp.]
MKVVVDTNIIFSCLLHSNGNIGEILFSSSDILEFFSCDYMRVEIRAHWSKLLKLSKLTDSQLQNAYDKTTSHIKFISEEIIKSSIWLKAEETVADIDEDDISFVALAKYLKGGLWTGDKKLYAGLKSKRFGKVYNTDDMLQLQTRLRRR